jgi:hypothetical protein
MALAYCILAHKNPAQVGRLLRAIAHPENICFLHYEKRAPRAEHAEVERLAKEIPGVYLLPSRPVLWGRFSQVGTQLEGMRRALECGRPWTHFITLTGQDFPLWPQARMIEKLAAAKDASYVSFFDPFATDYWKNVEERLGRFHLDSATLEWLLKFPGLGRWLRQICGWRDRMPSLPWVRRQLPEEFRYWGGSNHVILSRVAAAYIANDSNARRIVDWLKRSGHPDETVFQSTLLNGPLAGTVVNDDRRAILWEREGEPSPQTLRCADLPWLRGKAREEGKLFARKVDLMVDPKLMDELEGDL